MGLDDWLDYQQRIHPRAIELGLDRVREVWQRLGARGPAPVVITVGGTNGKGSTVAFLEAMLVADGRRVGAYTSPHLLRYNERVRIDGEDVGDAALIDVFERIEAARGEIALTYFEYGTLAALILFAEAGLDVALLEVGLGGRLDAVNIIDADAAIVTTVDLDHQDWLGNDLDSIGREKAGIFRNGRPAIVGDAQAPRGLLEEAARIGPDLRIAGRDFSVDVRASDWRWRGGDADLVLPHPSLDAGCQHANAAVAIAAAACACARSLLESRRDRARCRERARRCAPATLCAESRSSSSTSRTIRRPLACSPHGCARIRRTDARSPCSARSATRTCAASSSRCATSSTDWHLAGLAHDSPRGFAADALRDLVRGTHADVNIAGTHDDVETALAAAFMRAARGDRVVAFGSFFVAAAALQFARARGAAG